MTSIRHQLDDLTRPGTLFTREDDGLRCFACAHRCLIRHSKHGVCYMRANIGEELRVPWGYVAAANLDPIEKKPFMHFLPGTSALTFGMLGCNFHCDFCQNWVSSQTLRDPAADFGLRTIQETTPEALVEYALNSRAKSIVSSYNEPLITTEWALDIFRLAHEQGLKTAYVSNGFATPEVLQALQPHLDAFKIDLKCLTDAGYRKLGGRLEPVLDTIRQAHELGIWVEVVTLVIPEFNDSNEALWDSAQAILSVSTNIPWHVTAYYPTYKHKGGGRTPAETIQRAAEIGQEAGLRYVYAGNLPGRVGSLENTHCPKCQIPLIERHGYHVTANHLNNGGACPTCGEIIAGIWD